MDSVLPNTRIFDSEHVGYLLRHVLATETVTDLQEWRPWRGLVVVTAQQVPDYVGGTLVIPQSVPVREYWNEIHAGPAAAGISVRHVVPHAGRDELVRRIHSDALGPAARQWCLDHLGAHDAALPWLGRDAGMLDTTGIEPTRAACAALVR